MATRNNSSSRDKSPNRKVVLLTVEEFNSLDIKLRNAFALADVLLTVALDEGSVTDGTLVDVLHQARNHIQDAQQILESREIAKVEEVSHA